jgi:hypothetical protein
VQLAVDRVEAVGGHLEIAYASGVDGAIRIHIPIAGRQP